MSLEYELVLLLKFVSAYMVQNKYETLIIVSWVYGVLIIATSQRT